MIYELIGTKRNHQGIARFEQSLVTHLAKKFPAFLQNLRILDDVYSPMNPILRQLNSLHILTPYLCKIQFNILPSIPAVPRDLFPYVVPIEILYTFLISSMSTTRLIHLILLHCRFAKLCLEKPRLSLHPIGPADYIRKSSRGFTSSKWTGEI
jgi:hypothetical protein